MTSRLLPAALILLMQSALADSHAIGDQILACAGEPDDAARLACYDQAANSLSSEEQAAEPEVAAASNMREVAAVADTRVANTVEPAAPATVAESVEETNAAEDAPTADDAVEQFGMTPELAASRPEQQPEELREITAVVTAVRKTAAGEHVVTLDNGQTWAEKDAEFGFRVRVGDTVIIRRGRMGGHRMTRGYRASAVVRID